MSQKNQKEKKMFVRVWKKLGHSYIVSEIRKWCKSCRKQFNNSLKPEA
jgi:hypothetical protein